MVKRENQHKLSLLGKDRKTAIGALDFSDNLVRLPAIPDQSGATMAAIPFPYREELWCRLWRSSPVFLLCQTLICSLGHGADTPARSEAYLHKAFVRKEYGHGDRSFWIFEPSEPKPSSAPVVVFLHGWLEVNPATYGAWIEHLTRSGKVVIYPRYQSVALTDPNRFLPNTQAAVTEALEILDTGRGHVRPDLLKVAAIGHSAGGNLAAQLAAVASGSSLPRIKAVLALLPGEVQLIREPRFAKIPGDTLLVVAVAENDIVVGDVRARQIFREATAISPSRKKYIFYRSDLHGSPRLIADHLAPEAALPETPSADGPRRCFGVSRPVANALDRAGFWRVADLTMAAAFANRTLDEATDCGELFRHLGYWSDGRVVNPPIVGDDLSFIPRVIPNNGVRLIDWEAELGLSSSSAGPACKAESFPRIFALDATKHSP
jgi:dienelactone hydrolase